MSFAAVHPCFVSRLAHPALLLVQERVRKDLADRMCFLVFLFSIYNLGAYFVSKFYDAIFRFRPDTISVWPS
jgi:hypothetical protein